MNYLDYANSQQPVNGGQLDFGNLGEVTAVAKKPVWKNDSSFGPQMFAASRGHVNMDGKRMDEASFNSWAYGTSNPNLTTVETPQRGDTTIIDDRYVTSYDPTKHVGYYDKKLGMYFNRPIPQGNSVYMREQQ